MNDLMFYNNYIKVFIFYLCCVVNIVIVVFICVKKKVVYILKIDRG